MKLVLYYFPSCPYCQRVLNFLKAHPIQVEMKNIQENPEDKDKLRQIGGKTQVPCLVIDEKALYESLDIIDWLKKNSVPKDI